MPLDSRQAQAAVRAWRKFGKGRHPAQLNLGDCCVYALAKVSHEPVLRKGADFARTDIALVQ
jgi:ribonuclease VapC